MYCTLQNLCYNQANQMVAMISDHNPNSFRRGVMTLVLLALLEQQDMYGYRLVQEIALQSGGQLTTQEGSLYPVLYKCLDSGLISDKRVQVGKRMTRIYYHLEPAGAEKLAELKQAYLDTVHGVLQIVKGGDSHAHSEP